MDATKYEPVVYQTCCDRIIEVFRYLLIVGFTVAVHYFM